MATAAQIAANQHNAPLSKGTMSQAGRDTVRFNALQHGLTSRKVVLPGEDQSAYDDMLAAALQDYAPVGAGEQALVTEVAESFWRVRRAHTHEDSLWNLVMKEQLERAGKTGFDDELTSGMAMAAGFAEHGKDFDRLRRYMTTIERSYYKALDALHRAQKERHRLEQQKIRNELAAKRAEVAAQRAANAAARLRTGLVCAPKTPDISQPAPSVRLRPTPIGTVSQKPVAQRSIIGSLSGNGLVTPQIFRTALALAR